ncbi:flavin reductase family protein [Methyloraptor flagellatus]|uniref:Flavin reductase family protein n=1 Tax=Methyloraptor flagellatus TaxID=3162530 RepID=A0AAU7XEW1_9HYPH
MFYEVKNGHGLPHDPFKAIVAPRPIGWISSMGKDGSVNLAPYSYFNAIANRPPMVIFSSDGMKDSVSNIAETGEFVANLATWDLRFAMNQTSAPLPRGVDEFVHAGLEKAPSQIVKPPRVAAAPAALECKVLEIVNPTTLAGTKSTNFMVIGEVVAVHIDDAYLTDGMFDMTKARTIARCGYMDYAVVDSLFSITRPTA